MHLYLSLTREPAEPRTWLTPVVAVHAGLSHGDELGAKTYTGPSMWRDFQSDLQRMGGGTDIRPERFVDPVGFDIQMSWATVMANLYREGLPVYPKYAQPLNKKWQDRNTFELARIFTQCAYPKDVQFSEKDAFSFMGLQDAYLDEDARLVLMGDLYPQDERDAAIGKYMTALFRMHARYSKLFPGA